MKRSLKDFLFFLSALLFFPLWAFADGDPGTWFQTIIENFLNKIVWPLFIGASVAMLIWAGFLFLSSEGDPTRVKAAQRAVIWGVVGIFVAIVGFSAVSIV